MKLSDRQRLQAAIKGDPKQITKEHCCRAAYYIKEEAKKAWPGKIAIALVRTGLLDAIHAYAQNSDRAEIDRVVHLAKLVEHLEGPLSGVTHDALLQAEQIFMKQEK